MIQRERRTTVSRRKDKPKGQKLKETIPFSERMQVVVFSSEQRERHVIITEPCVKITLAVLIFIQVINEGKSFTR